MFGPSPITKKTRVVGHADAGPSIEISIIGKHRDGCGNDLMDSVDQAISEMKPAGVAMNLQDFKDRFSNDIGALLLPLLDAQTLTWRPFCIVADRRNPYALRSLWEFVMIPEIKNATYFSDIQSGMRRRLLRDRDIVTPHKVADGVP
jgi:hypothetical protein